jgi:hypothetical protein
LCKLINKSKKGSFQRQRKRKRYTSHCEHTYEHHQRPRFTYHCCTFSCPRTNWKNWICAQQPARQDSCLWVLWSLSTMIQMCCSW